MSDTLTAFKQSASSGPAKVGYGALVAAVVFGSSWSLFAQEIVENARRVPVVEQRIEKLETSRCFDAWTSYQTLKAVSPGKAAELGESPEHPKRCVEKVRSLR